MANEEALRKKYASRARTRTPRLSAQLALFQSVLERHSAEAAKDKKVSSVLKAKLEQDWQTLEPDAIQLDVGFIAGALWAKGWLNLAQYEAAAQKDT